MCVGVWVCACVCGVYCSVYVCIVCMHVCMHVYACVCVCVCVCVLCVWCVVHVCAFVNAVSGIYCSLNNMPVHNILLAAV